ncbi:hypothetical protein ANN_27634 [Periplaneta americana]|uniref:Reverse transcriptase domain-containing protein n=1 Tax=Periplaneta americana TaxID=6978 RepID=A0ABQ8RWH7_PERAM|nr:hypothetical protein ANN_27634 [Periplaneta americana]
MDLIKIEPEVDPLDLQPHDNRDEEEKKPLTEEGNFVYLQVDQIKTEYVDHSYDLTPDVQLEESSAAVTFPATNCKVETSSNPERATKRAREKRREKYEYQKTQFLYYNQRRKAVRSALNDQCTSCKVDINKIHHHFPSRLSTENLCECPEYSPVITESQQVVLDSTENLVITKQEVAFAVSKIAVDTAPGPDHVLVRALKDETCYEVTAMIATTMLTKYLVPVCLKQARTVLIYKGGDEMNLENWRPIKICSVVRRVIERILDFRLRALINFCESQRGFINSPGILINTSILELVLVAAKSQKKDVTLVFLDISKAFDNVGYKHLQNTLLGLGLPSKLSNLILELQRDNKTQTETRTYKTKQITIKRGVMQGSPLSPSLYNISTGHILEELSTHDLQEEHGFSVSPGLPKITSLGFADDTVIVARNEDSARVLVELAITRFNEIGLNINIDKCKCIFVTKGFIKYKSLDLISGQIIPSIVPEENIKYLGVSYHTSTVFDAVKCMEKLKNKLDILASTPLLQHHQKYSVLCSYICPTLIYQFQTTPLNKIPAKFLSDADVLIKTTLKEILQLPTDTPDNMLYADRKYMGLGLFKSSWEAFFAAYQCMSELTTIPKYPCKLLSQLV